MATKKQLAALAKGRAAMAAKRAGKTAKKKAPAKKRSTTRKSNPAPRTSPVSYGVEVTAANGATGYLTAWSMAGGPKFDTLASKAKLMDYAGASTLAGAVANCFKNKVRSVKPVIDWLKKKVADNDPVYHRNPVPPSSKAKLREAADLYEQFTGHDADHYHRVQIKWPDTALQVGDCDGILYTTVRDGKTEHYIHRFKKSARPLLVASHNGKQLGLIGGRFRFTDRGIVDD